MSKFGWNKAFENDEVRVAKAFFGENGTNEQVKALLAALYAEIDPSVYDKSCEFEVKYGALSLSQKGAKEYFHDGSVEPRKTLTLKVVDSDEEFKPLSDKPVLFSAWLSACREATLSVKKSQASDPSAPRVILLKDFLGFPLVILEIESWE